MGCCCETGARFLTAGAGGAQAACWQEQRWWAAGGGRNWNALSCALAFAVGRRMGKVSDCVDACAGRRVVWERTYIQPKGGAFCPADAAETRRA